MFERKILLYTYREILCETEISQSMNLLITGSGVLLKMEVGIRKKRRGEGPEGTLFIYDH